MNTPANYVGQPIRSLQTMLRTIAHVDETLLKLVPDGIYGPNTVQAVREFQRQNALPVTGETDNATWNKLVAVYTVQSPSVLPAAASMTTSRPPAARRAPRRNLQCAAPRRVPLPPRPQRLRPAAPPRPLRRVSAPPETAFRRHRRTRSASLTRTASPCRSVQ